MKKEKGLNKMAGTQLSSVYYCLTNNDKLTQFKGKYTQLV